MLTKHHHRPAHLFRDETYYFITGATYQKRHLLKKEHVKIKLLEFFRRYFDKYQWKLEHWVILNNHYHLICQSKKGRDLSNIFRITHSRSAEYIHKNINCEKPIWWNYWDYCPRTEEDYYIRLNYLLYNPVKHGYVKNLHDYSFSSFSEIFVDIGRANLSKQFRKYPEYKDLTLEEAMDDNF